jgi:hypothetical protein
MKLFNRHQTSHRTLLGNGLLIILIFIVVLFIAAAFDYLKADQQGTSTQSSTSVTTPAPKSESTPSAPQPAQTQPKALPQTLQLKVPFTPQAPTANWDELHNEACEEASAIMAHAYFSGRKETRLPAQYVESEIAKLTEWQKKTQGYYLSQTSEEVARMIEQIYGLKTKLVRDVTEQMIKQALNDNQLVLLPADGRLLGNPNFRQPGPAYHMFVITGYNERGFITNDPGTRNGLNYFYTFATMYKANGDWHHDIHAVDTKDKVAIIVYQ